MFGMSGVMVTSVNILKTTELYTVLLKDELFRCLNYMLWGEREN